MSPRKSATKSSASARLSTKKNEAQKTPVQSPPVDAAGPVTSPTTSRQKRRKSPSDDSDIEIIATDLRPSKKKKASASPPPGTEAYKKLPPVSFSVQDGTPKKVSGLQFGSIDPAESPSSSTTARPPSGRPKIKSEKARLADELDVAVVQEALKKASRSGKGAKPAKTAPSSPLQVKMESADDADAVSPSKAEGKKPVRAVPHAIGYGPKKIKKPSVDDDVVMSAGESDGTLPSPSVAFAPLPTVSSDVESVASEPESSPAPLSEISDSDDEPEGETVMLAELQAPILADLYEHLPVLQTFCNVEPFSASGGGQSMRVNYEELRPLLSEASRSAIVQGLGFTRAGFFVNTARIDPNLLLVDSSRMIRLSDTRHLAIGIMLGLVTECNIITEFTGGTSSAPYSLRKVTIAPFAQEMRRDTSVWGKVLGFHNIVGQVSPLGISFSTRRKSEKQGTPLSPMKSAGYLLSVTSNISSPSTSRHVGSYPSSRGFDDHIPIYDGRLKHGPGFNFTPEDFASLSNLPLYRNGTKDLSEQAVVAVGYTVGTWEGRNGKNLSTNLQFLIVLGMAIARPL